MFHMIALVFVLLIGNLNPEAPTYQFMGKHFLASYMDCDTDALSDIDGTIAAMDSAVRASGANILAKTPYIFPPNGLTIVYLLSESHASLHTYPEHNACFVDLFTCGDHCSAEKFDKIFRAYLKPKKVNAHIFLRHNNIEEETYSQDFLPN
ncbi:MAG: speD [Parachlamydiales bacterium]|nr:speD [Parachlamydiales bacterium]